MVSRGVTGRLRCERNRLASVNIGLLYTHTHTHTHTCICMCIRIYRLLICIQTRNTSPVARGHLKAKIFVCPKVGEIDSQHLIAVARGPLLDALPSLRDALALHLPSAPQDGGVRVFFSLSYSCISRVRRCVSRSKLLRLGVSQEQEFKGKPGTSRVQGQATRAEGDRGVGGGEVGRMEVSRESAERVRVLTIDELLSPWPYLLRDYSSLA